MDDRVVFGRIGAEDVHSVQIANGRGMRASIITYGARLTELFVPDRDGVVEDVVLGFDTLQEYLATDHYFGATCGRYGNRIGNGQFMLGGSPVQLDRNEGENHLHGGMAGFDRKIWTIAGVTANAATFTAISEDGEMGFPGRCTLKVVYALSEANALTITMSAETERTTVMNMVHHSYFNLAGQGTCNILGHNLHLNSGFYTPVDAGLLATGEVLSVAGTAFDFRTAKPIGRDIALLPSVGEGIFEQGGGYDHNWCLGDAGANLRHCLTAHDPASGRTMTLHTTEPGVQIYTGGYLTDKVRAKRGRMMCQFAGFTLETQKFPGSPNHGHFPDCLLHPGEIYEHRMHFAFGTDTAP